MKNEKDNGNKIRARPNRQRERAGNGKSVNCSK